jgi:hypothetical protein
MSYARLSGRFSFTGLEITEFDIISKEIESKYYEYERKRLSNRKRKRDLGAGRPFKLKLRKILDASSVLHYRGDLHYLYIIGIAF